MIIKKNGDEKNMKKIIIGVLTLFLLIGIVCAADINNLKMPNDWEPISNGTYHQKDPFTNGGNGHNMMIQKWTDSLKEEYCSNHTDENYLVKDYGNNTMVYVFDEDTGCFEVVEIDGEKYFVNFWYTKGSNIDEAAKTYDFMMEFNKLNNVQPIKV